MTSFRPAQSLPLGSVLLVASKRPSVRLDYHAQPKASALEQCSQLATLSPFCNGTRVRRMPHYHSNQLRCVPRLAKVLKAGLLNDTSTFRSFAVLFDLISTPSFLPSACVATLRATARPWLIVRTLVLPPSGLSTHSHAPTGEPCVRSGSTAPVDTRGYEPLTDTAQVQIWWRRGRSCRHACDDKRTARLGSEKIPAQRRQRTAD
ncbi:hypothetical protein GY45DRAFT_40263 [Cubamyces sp. BRFM 1775]|nr:hypothetical protein GY45DRAFT_40263 [Cubamyces sp. BRFM 1775]